MEDMVSRSLLHGEKYVKWKVGDIGAQKCAATYEILVDRKMRLYNVGEIKENLKTLGLQRDKPPAPVRQSSQEDITFKNKTANPFHTSEILDESGNPMSHTPQDPPENSASFSEAKPGEVVSETVHSLVRKEIITPPAFKMLQ